MLTRNSFSVVMTEHTGDVLVTGEHYSQAWSVVVLVSMIIFVASFASGLGNVPWHQGELFGLEGTYLFLYFLVSVDSLISPLYYSFIRSNVSPHPCIRILLLSSPRHR